MTRSILLVLLASFVAAAQAQKLKDPASADSSLAVVQMTANLATIFGNRPVPLAEAVLGRIGADGKVEQELKPTARYGRYMFFENLAPGKYKVVNATYVHSTTFQGPSTTSGHITVSSSQSFGQATPVPLEPAVQDVSLVEVPAGSVVFLGDFEVGMSIKMTFPLPSGAVEKPAQATRTDEGRGKAFTMLAKEYPQSPWSQRLPRDFAPPPPAPEAPPAPPQDINAGSAPQGGDSPFPGAPR